MPTCFVTRMYERLHGRHGSASVSGPHGPESDGGFALVEVLVGMIIFAIVSAGATLAIIGGAQSNSVSQARVGAANIAQQALQRAESLPRASLAATPSTTSTVTVGSATYSVQRQVTYTPATASACPTTIVSGTPYAMVVHVVVSGTGQNSRSVTMDTVLAC